MESQVFADLLFSTLNDAIMEAESLTEFYTSSLENRDEMKRRMEDKYKYGLILSKELDKLAKCKDAEHAKQIIKELNAIVTDDGHLLSDYVEVNFEMDDEIVKVSYSLILQADQYVKKFDPKIAKEKRRKVSKYNTILSNSTLLNIVTIFESYLKKVYSLLILLEPKKYLSGKSISLADIFEKEKKEIIFDSLQFEVDSKMYDSIELLDSLKVSGGICIDRYEAIQKPFEEICLRRNLYVHSQGVVNSKYLGKVDEKFRCETKSGDILPCDKPYIQNSLGLLLKILCSIHYEIMAVRANDCQEWFYKFGEIGFEFLCTKNYEIAEFIYHMLSKHKGFEFRECAVYNVNYINAQKQLGKNVVKQIERFDLSIATDDFKIAKLCLQDKNEEVYKLLTETYPKSFNAQRIRDWPIFIGFRGSEWYEKFSKEHSKDFEMFTFENENISSINAMCAEVS